MSNKRERQEFEEPTPPLIISLDGNIGAGKSTLLEIVEQACADFHCVTEPVAAWCALELEGKSLLELFYEDKKRFAFSFQSFALLSRIKTMRDALKHTKKRVVISERSVLTDKYVFAEMLRDSGDLSSMEWEMYSQIYDSHAGDLPLKAVIYIDTDSSTSKERIIKRGRAGESSISTDFLADLEKQHLKWIDNTTLPVCRISTAAGPDHNVATIRAFVASLLSGAKMSSSPETDDAKKAKWVHLQADNDKENVPPAASAALLEV